MEITQGVCVLALWAIFSRRCTRLLTASSACQSETVKPIQPDKPPSRQNPDKALSPTRPGARGRAAACPRLRRSSPAQDTPPPEFASTFFPQLLYNTAPPPAVHWNPSSSRSSRTALLKPPSDDQQPVGSIPKTSLNTRRAWRRCHCARSRPPG